MLSRNSSLLSVFSRRDFTSFMASMGVMSARNLRSIHMRSRRLVQDGDIQIWMRPLSDGTHALGIFNLGTADAKVNFGQYLGQLNITGLKTVRDLWRQQDLSPADLSYFIPTHGVKFLKVRF